MWYNSKTPQAVLSCALQRVSNHLHHTGVRAAVQDHAPERCGGRHYTVCNESLQVRHKQAVETTGAAKHTDDGPWHSKVLNTHIHKGEEECV